MFKSWRRKWIRYNRIYIIPTWGGLMFLGAIGVLILTAATYNNNLIYLLAFFMFAVFIVSMIQTHYNLKGVRVRFRSSDETFEEAELAIWCEITQSRSRYKTQLQLRADSEKFVSLESPKHALSPEETTKLVKVPVRAPKMGLHELPDFILETSYPLGLFRAWKVFRFEGKIVVYPKPQYSRLLTAKGDLSGREALALRTSPDGDFGELKDYLMGESYRQIAWKHYARTGELFTKVHWGQDHKHYEIPWIGEKPDLETNLRLMSSWIQIALGENATFEMHTPDFTIESGSGLDQARRCWRALAEIKSRVAA